MEMKRYQWKGKWTGVNVYPITVFTPDLQVDYDAMRSLFRYLVNAGVSGLGVNGHTGEGECLTREEKKKIIQIAREEVQGKIPICTGIHTHTIDAGVEEAREMEKAGVDTVMILAPAYYLLNTMEDPRYGIEYHKAIARAVNIPVVMHQSYDHQGACEYPTWAFAKLFREIDNLVAVKLANGWDTKWLKLEADMQAARAIGRENISLFPGTASMITFLWGCDGCFTGYANFDPYGLIDLWNAVQRGDLKEARKIHNERIRPLEEVIYVSPMVDLITKYKEVTYWTGLIPSPRVKHRLPLREEVRRKLYDGLKKTTLDIVRDYE